MVSPRKCTSVRAVAEAAARENSVEGNQQQSEVRIENNQYSPLVEAPFPAQEPLNKTFSFKLFCKHHHTIQAVQDIIQLPLEEKNERAVVADAAVRGIFVDANQQQPEAKAACRAVVQPELFSEDSVVNTHKFRLFCKHHYTIHALQNMVQHPLEVQYPPIKFADLLNKFKDEDYVATSLENEMRLMYFATNIYNKIDYFLGRKLDANELSRNFTEVSKTHEVVGVFEQIRRFGYNLVFYENDAVDYYTFKMFRKHSAAYQSVDDSQSKMTPELRNTLAMDFMESDFWDLVQDASDNCPEWRPRLKFAKNFKMET